MPTSGLVISTSQDADLSSLLASLDACESITREEPVVGRLPIVTETANKDEDKALWEWLWNLPGVESVDVAFIYLSEGIDAVGAREFEAPCDTEDRISDIAIVKGRS